MANGFELELNGPGAIYYTVDGSDPRLPGGGISPNALFYNGPIEITESLQIRARALDGQEWSAISDAEFFVHVPATSENLAVTEINYNPVDPSPTELQQNATWTDNDFEFLEFVAHTPGEHFFGCCFQI